MNITKTKKVMYEIRETSTGSYVAMIDFYSTDDTDANIKVFSYPNLNRSEALLSYMTNELFPYIRNYKDNDIQDHNLLIVNDDVNQKNFFLKNPQDRENFSKIFVKLKAKNCRIEKIKIDFFAGARDLRIDKIYNQVKVRNVGDEFKEALQNHLYNEILDQDNLLKFDSENKLIKDIKIDLKALKNPPINNKTVIVNESISEVIKEDILPPIQNNGSKRLTNIEVYNETIENKKYIILVKEYNNGSSKIDYVKYNVPTQLEGFFKNFRQQYNSIGKNKGDLLVKINDDMILDHLPERLKNSPNIIKSVITESRYKIGCINLILKNKDKTKDFLSKMAESQPEKIVEYPINNNKEIISKSDSIVMSILHPEKNILKEHIYVLTEIDKDGVLECEWSQFDTINGFDYEALLKSKLESYPEKKQILLKTNKINEGISKTRALDFNGIGVKLEKIELKRMKALSSKLGCIVKDYESTLLQGNNISHPETFEIKNESLYKKSLTSDVHFIIFEGKMHAMIKMKMHHGNVRTKWVKMDEIKDKKDLKDFITRHLFNPQLNNPAHSNLIIRTNNEYLKRLLLQADLETINGTNNIKIITSNDSNVLMINSLKKEIEQKNSYGKLADLYRVKDKVPDKNKMVIYTDASLRDKQGKIKTGYGIVIRAPGSDNVLYKIKARTDTHNDIHDVEVFAIKRAVQFIKTRIEKGEISADMKFEIRSDSLNNISGLNGGKAVVNNAYCRKMQKEIKELSRGLKLEYTWVKGHHIDPFNKLVDKLAGQATEHKNNSFIVAFKDEDLLRGVKNKPRLKIKT